VERLSLPGGEIPGTEGHKPSLRGDYVNTAGAKTLQVQVVRILKGHGADGEVASFAEAEKPIEIVLLERGAATALCGLRNFGLRAFFHGGSPAAENARHGAGRAVLLGAVAAAGGLSQKKKPFGAFHEIDPPKGALLVLAPGGLEVSDFCQPSGLLFQLSHEPGQGDPGILFRRKGVTPRIGYGLKVHSPHRGKPGEPEPYHISYLVGVDSPHEGGNQHHSQPGLPACLKSGLLDLAEISAPKGVMGGFPETVELEKDPSRSGALEYPGISRLFCQAYPIGIDLYSRKAEILRKGYKIR
jgi:hypothetical protein